MVRSREKGVPLPLTTQQKLRGDETVVSSPLCSVRYANARNGRCARPSVRAGRAKQVAAEGGMPDGLVADHIDQRWLARFERAIECRDYLVGVRDVFAMAAHLGENLVIADVLKHVER